MAHFTKLNQNNIVITVNVVHNSELLVDGVENEQKGVDFLNNLFNTNDNWKQTSYNTRGGVHKLGGTPFRKNYAGVGYTYDEVKDAFIEPQPYPSWTLNEDTCQWEAPVAFPNDGKSYNWNESTTSWDLLP
tara:strand:- start:357 stop:749 length:393 start_codon:yes stop_codon:yes gene_type:complete